MAAELVSLNAIEDFLAHKRMALVGVSRDEKNFSVTLWKEFRRRGYDVVPVNPSVGEIQGQPCFANVQDIEPRVDWALLMTSPAVSEAVVRDCAAAGIRRVWLYRAGSTGAVSAKAIELCHELGIEVVAGGCPFMFFPNNGFHKVHGWIERIAGKYPKREKAAYM